jgi:hypothetical protein
VVILPTMVEVDIGDLYPQWAETLFYMWRGVLATSEEFGWNKRQTLFPIVPALFEFRDWLSDIFHYYPGGVAHRDRIRWDVRNDHTIYAYNCTLADSYTLHN